MTLHRTAPRGRLLALATAGALALSAVIPPAALAATDISPDGTVTVTADTATAAPAAPTIPSTATASPAPTAPTAITSPTWCSTAIPSAPWRLVAARSADDPTTATIEWAAVACATRYNVSVFVDGSDRVEVVPGNQSTMTISSLDPTKTYRIQVSSRNDAGLGASSGIFYLRPVGLAAVTGLKVKYSAVIGATFLWNRPAVPGLSKCVLTVKRVASQKVVLEDTIACDLGEYPLPELDAREMFVITMKGVNEKGDGPSARIVVGGDKPLPVKSVGAIRDPGDPNQVIVSWLPSDNTGRGTVIGYEVGYGNARADERIVVKDTDTEVRVPADKSVVVIVRVLTETGKSRWSKWVRIPLPDAAKVATTDQRVDLIEQEGVISIAATRAVARNSRLAVRITPTANNGGFTETQYSQEGAQVMTFRKVPEGSYLVIVDADGKEMARRYINVGKLGLMNAADWTVVDGKADITGQAVDMTFGGETRVFSTRPFATQDVVLETRAHLRKGQGYGVWFRANAGRGIKASGLTVQYDPGWNNNFIIRQWHNGTECSTPIARTPFPAGMKVYDAHTVVVAAQGDSLYVTIDGQKLFDVPSLSQAIASNSCKYPDPTGTMVGLRTWGSSAATFTGTTVR